MLKIGFMFPGQGAQYIGMGNDLYTEFPEVKALYEQAHDILGYDLADVCFNDPGGIINRTEVTQPAVMVTSMAMYTALAIYGISPVMVAGLSLGEYTAMVASGAISFADAVQLLAIRGRLMQEAVAPDTGAMMAVSGLSNELVDEICNQFGIEPANYNCPGQVVVAGYVQAIEAAGKEFTRQGGRVARLAVSVPSHCRLMRPAALALAPIIENVVVKSPTVPIISNVSAELHQPNSIKELLIAQLYSPVRWEDSMRLMLSEVDYLVEVGPGSVLSALARRLDRKKVLGAVGDRASMEQLLRKVKEI